MKRIHYLLLGLAVSLCIAATVGPVSQPTRVIAGSNVTVVTNNQFSYTVSASAGSSSGSISNNTGLGTNTTIYGLTVNTGLTNNSMTASEIVGTDANKKVVSLAVATYPSLTELAYVKGVTSALQTQMDAKAPLASPTFTGTVTSPALILSSETASTIASFDGSKNVKSLALATYPSLTELSYVKGATSSLQTQINALGGGSGILTSNGLGTNTTFYATAGTTNRPATFISTNTALKSYFDKDSNLVIGTNTAAHSGVMIGTGLDNFGITTAITMPASGALEFGLGAHSFLGTFVSIGTDLTASGAGKVAYFSANSGKGWTVGNAYGYGWNSAAAGNVSTMNSVDTWLSRNAANAVELSTGTIGIANRGTFLAAKYTGRAGTSSSPYNAGGVIWIDTTTTGNITTGNDTILTNNFGANVFAANGDAVDFTVGGNFGNTINTRAVRLYISGQTVFDTGSTILTSGDAGWTLVSTITRTSATALQVNTRLIPDYPLTGSSPIVKNAAITVGLTTNNPFLLTGESTATDDVVRYIGRAEFIPAP